jgi:hypothetical protein
MRKRFLPCPKKSLSSYPSFALVILQLTAYMKCGPVSVWYNQKGGKVEPSMPRHFYTLKMKKFIVISSGLLNQLVAIRRRKFQNEMRKIQQIFIFTHK